MTGGGGGNLRVLSYVHSVKGKPLLLSIELELERHGKSTLKGAAAGGDGSGNVGDGERIVGEGRGGGGEAKGVLAMTFCFPGCLCDGKNLSFFMNMQFKKRGRVRF